MRARIDEWTEGWVDGRMGEWLNGWLDGWKDEQAMVVVATTVVITTMMTIAVVIAARITAVANDGRVDGRVDMDGRPSGWTGCGRHLRRFNLPSWEHRPADGMASSNTKGSSCSSGSGFVLLPRSRR
jgi:hypothetical protein